MSGWGKTPKNEYSALKRKSPDVETSGLLVFGMI
jgi:hypothetical protein